jgi:DNA-directed RNA polymerase specialized sigma24 family protein
VAGAGDDSVVGWWERLQAGDEDAVRQLWDRYFPRLVGLARERLRGLPHGAAADEEDAALSAFDSVCRRARRGDFPDVQDRDSLWRLLMTVTARKVARLVRDQNRQKRGGGRAAGEPARDEPGAGASVIDRVAGSQQPPDLQAEVSEEFDLLLDRLGDDGLRRIALWKLDGHSNAEICGLAGCAPATVERRLALIRRIWEQERSPA